MRVILSSHLRIRYPSFRRKDFFHSLMYLFTKRTLIPTWFLQQNAVFWKIKYSMYRRSYEMHYSSFILKLLAEVINVASWIRISVNEEWTSKVPSQVYYFLPHRVEKLSFNFRILFLCGYMLILLLILTAGWKFFVQKRYYVRFNWKDLPINPNALNIQSLHSTLVFSFPMSNNAFCICEMNI